MAAWDRILTGAAWGAGLGAAVLSLLTVLWWAVFAPDGLKDGQQEIDVGGVREDTTSTGGFKPNPVQVIETAINVVPANTVNIAYVMGGVDPGSPEIGVTLVFE